ncbi:conserved protein of unknown function [Tenacibaculum sp. 190130A14a]|uniref:Tetratricopeptide repeat protein n=1 Tax=Tenacibaculum polynesiense TaxID=3137857 RepID=A0ABM9PC61_9FLAO
MLKKEKLIIVLVLLCFSLKAQDKSEKELESQIDSIGLKIDETLTNLDKSYVNQLYDIQALSELFLVESKNKRIQKFNKEFYTGFRENFDFGNILLREIEAGASYDYLGYEKSDDGGYKLLFRLYGEGLNYHKHILKYINGEFKIVDTYIALSGENISDSFGSIYKGVLFKSGLFPKLGKQNGKGTLTDLFIIQKIKKLQAEGKFEEAYELFGTLSDEGKNKKIYKIVNLMIAAELNDEDKYLDAIKSYEDQFPNDVSLYLVSIDGYILKKKYDKALETINNLDKAVGGDSFLNFMKGNIYYLKKNYELSEKLFLETTEEYPSFFEAFDSLLSVYIETDKTQEALGILDVMIKEFELTKELLGSLVEENFPNFSKKEEVIEWLKQK